MATHKSIRVIVERCAVLIALSYLLAPILVDAQRHGRAPSFPARHEAILLTIKGRIAKTLYLSSADFRSFPRSTIRIAQPNGDAAVYEGVPLIEILRKAGARLGGHDEEELRTCVEAISHKGSRVIFSLPELDPAFLGSKVILADTLNGKPIEDSELMLVSGTDNITLRSVRHLTTIRIQRLR